MQKPLGRGAAESSAESLATERSLLGLNWLNFLVAAMQAGFGPFLSVYLTAQLWNPEDIGFALSIGTTAAMVAQVPAGALVDAMASKRLAARIALLAVAGAAVTIALVPMRLFVVAALVLQAAASSMLNLAIAAITLALSHENQLGERLGYNVRFSAVGAGIAAALMGAVGYWVSERAIFFLAAGLGIAALAALRVIHPSDLAEAPSRTDHLSVVPRHKRTEDLRRIRDTCTDHRLLIVASGIALFQLGNAAILPLAANALTRTSARLADLVLPAAIIVPQVITAILSPWIGRLAQNWGRRPVALLGLAALPIRAALFAISHNLVLLVSCQALDGISASVIGVMLPLFVADITRRGGRFNLGMGIVGLVSGIGATLSTSIGGAIALHFG
ncbi:MAG: MFS transporter, partial [Acetobacteraceae bacterium]|nr:MFS transporter [Acetobacteraceae bacterium]